jgi:predicted house-cleaning noncanonical NTP pyrophosphatase (MazG superfamily)
MENTNEEVLEETEQEELVEAPEQEEENEQSEKIIAEKAKVKEDDDEDDDDDDEEEEEDEQVKKEEVKIPSTKAGMIKALFDKVNNMKKEEVSTKWKDLMGVAEASVDDLGGPTPSGPDDADPKTGDPQPGKKKKKIKVDIPEIDVKEDIEALVQGEELSEEFKSKASTIFEAAVHQKVMEVITTKVEELEEEYQKNLQEEIVSFRDELTDKVDGYLNYVVEEWMKENELALEGSLKGEITEEFIGGLKDLFTEHYIEVPDEKVDIVESLYDKVEELEEKLNSQIEDNVKTKDELNEYRKDKILEEVCEDLADTQSEKMKSLVEGVSYDEDADNFENKVKTIKESYFPNQTKQDANVEQESDVPETEETPEMSNIMEAYSKAIARN